MSTPTIKDVAREKTTVFVVTIDQAESFEEMIKAGQYDEVNSAVRSVSFPWKRKGSKKVELTLVQFDRPLAPGEMTRLMEARRYRPAFIEELLALGKEHPDLQRRIPIVALGSGRIIQARRHAACPSGSQSSRCLQLAVIYRRWSTCYRFALVRR